jgi:hypothetical protein
VYIFTCIFCSSLKKLSAVQKMQLQMIRWSLNSELEGMWKEAVATLFQVILQRLLGKDEAES